MFKCETCNKTVDNDGELCDNCLTFMLDEMSEQEMHNRIAECFGEVIDRSGW
jgi:hypothetical protein